MAAINGVAVSVDPISKRISVTSPYNPEFTERARALGGKWDSMTRSWVFVKATEQQVRDVCMAVYGVTDGTPMLTREQLEEKLNRYLQLVMEVQTQLDELDVREGKAP